MVVMTDREALAWALPVKGLQHSLCSTCRWKHEGAGTCLAFGGGIPTEILLGVVDHRLPYPGDLGVRYEAREDAVLDPAEILVEP